MIPVGDFHDSMFPPGVILHSASHGRGAWSAGPRARGARCGDAPMPDNARQETRGHGGRNGRFQHRIHWWRQHGRQPHRRAGRERNAARNDLGVGPGAETRKLDDLRRRFGVNV